MKRILTFALLTLFSASLLADLSMSYRRLLPLDGGSNFRDMGGYVTEDGRQVVRGKLFRSGAMAALTASDMQYLDQFDFKTVVDLRTNEEIDLFPNYWVKGRDIAYVTGDYSFTSMMGESEEGERPARPEMSEVYPQILKSIEPQLKAYFDAALNEQTPMVVNCSAGQDRTGVTSALMLSLLGVPYETIIEDYLLSTDFRRPDIEQADVDLEAAAKTNAFAAMMLQYREAMPSPDRPNPLMTSDQIPYLVFVFDSIDKHYGSIDQYARQVLDLDGKDIEKLKTLYLE